MAEGDFRHLTVREGLSSNRTYQAVQDSTGFVWITTDEGVDRYDGKNVVHYPLEGQSEFAGMGYQFNRIFRDARNGIYVVSNRNYVYRFDRSGDRFVQINAFRPYHGRYVLAATVTPDGDILVATPASFFYYRHGMDTVQRNYSPQLVRDVYSLLPYHDGFLVGKKSGVFFCRPDLLQPQPFARFPEGKTMSVNIMLLDKKRQRLWLATRERGLWYLDIRDTSFHEAGNNMQLQDFPIWDLTLCDSSRLMIGTNGAGLFLYDPEPGRVEQRFVYDQEKEASLSSNVVHGILRTREDLYFIMTDIGGVNIYDPHRLPFVTIRHVKGNRNSLRNNVIHAIDEVRPGVVAFGTDRGVSLWYRDEERWERLERGEKEGRNQVVTAITHARDGTFWVAYFIRRMKVFSASPRYRYLPREMASCRNAKALFFVEEDRTLWSDHQGGKVRLLAYDFEARSLNRYLIPPVAAITDFGNTVVVGTVQGLYRQQKGGLDLAPLGILPASLRRVSTLESSGDTALWVGSEMGGVALFLPGRDTLIRFDMSRGMASDKVLALRCDKTGRAWALTDQGLSRIDPVRGEIVNYFPSDGLLSGDFKYHAICLLSSGEMIAGGTNGATLFDPLALGRPRVAVNLVFTDLYVNQRKVPGHSHVLREEMLDRTSFIRLRYNENAFSIGFTNIDLFHPGQAAFSWMLEGYDHDWSEPVRQGRAVYTNLPPGRYTFRVRLITPLLAGEPPPERSLAIVITPPFWKTPVAFLLYGVMIVSLVLLVLYYNRLMHDVRSAREKLRYIANMAHEIKTPLTLIRAPISDLVRQEKNKKTEEKLSLALHNLDKLQRKIGQFLDFRRIEKPGQVHPERLDLVAFVRNKVFAFDLIARAREVKIHYESVPDSLEVLCDPDLLDRILSNLLSNAVKFNKRGGFVNVRLEREGEFWLLKVTDSGIGIPAREKKKIFRPFFRAGNAVRAGIPGSGIGLALVYDMVKALGGTIAFTSREGGGTTFVLKVPVGMSGQMDDSFPSVAEGTDAGTNGTSGEPKKKAFTVLVAEDDQEMRAYIAKELGDQYRVITAADGQEAYHLTMRELPDLVLADVAMPRMNGRQLCARIKNDPATSHIPVILLSGLDDKDHILKGLEAGADDYITKPFDTSLLSARIESMIQLRRQLRERLMQQGREGDAPSFRNEHDRRFVEKITRVVEENIADPDLSVRMLYTAAGMSRTAFYHKLRSLIDLSPAEFIRMVRLNKAREMLRTGRYNVSEVAYRCGFSDAKYFSTAFKKQFGESPSSYLGKKNG